LRFADFESFIETPRPKRRQEITMALIHRIPSLAATVGALMLAFTMATPAYAGDGEKAPKLKSGPPGDQLIWGARGDRSPCAVVKCTKEQRAAFRENVAAMKATIAQATLEMHQLKAKLADLLRADSLDRAALDQVFSEISAQQAKIGEARKKALADLFAGLDAEQRARLADKVHKLPKVKAVKPPPGGSPDDVPNGKKKEKEHGKSGEEHGKGKDKDKEHGKGGKKG
jgi:Spy/CpxP family protein refolding chaperone